MYNIKQMNNKECGELKLYMSLMGIIYIFPLTIWEYIYIYVTILQN